MRGLCDTMQTFCDSSRWFCESIRKPIANSSHPSEIGALPTRPRGAPSVTCTVMFIGFLANSLDQDQITPGAGAV